MAIKIATMIGDNYGSALQAFALQQSIKECGGGSSIVKLRPKSYIIRFAKTYLIPTKYDGVKKKARKAVSDFKNRRKRRKVREFYQKNIVVEIHRTIEELLSNEKSRITFICGSDQIWNPQFQPNQLFYLDFSTKLNIKKYSYAASIAVSSLAKEECEYYKRKLKDFEGVSVREKTGKYLLDELLDKNVRVDVDPVLLLGADKWESMMSARFSGKDYILLYMLRPMPELLSFAKMVAQSRGLKLLYIGDFDYDDADIESCHDAGVEDFLNAIYSARYVITNSFHATVFSTIFKKKFCSYAVSRTGTRVLDFLDDFNLQECRIGDLNRTDYSFNQKIDWDEISSIINRKKQESLKYIRSIVNQDK